MRRTRKSTSPKMSEVDLGELCVAWLESEGWDVYQEVNFKAGTADIVAIRQDDTLVCELKLAPSLDFLAQLIRWEPYATHIVAVLPHNNRRDLARAHGPSAFVWACRAGGFGLTTLQGVAGGSFGAKPLLEPVRRDVKSKLREALNPKQKVMAKAGTNRGGAWAPWRDTVEALAKLIAETGTLPVATAMKRVKHHYHTQAAAYAGGRRLAAWKLIPGVKIQKIGRNWFFAPKEDTRG